MGKKSPGPQTEGVHGATRGDDYYRGFSFNHPIIIFSLSTYGRSSGSKSPNLHIAGSSSRND